jgi:hypothetical protein
MARHCGGGAGDRGWGSMRNGGEPTRFYSLNRCGKCSGVGEEEGVWPRNEGATLATRHLAYPRLGNLRVVKADQSNLMLLGFIFVYLGCSAGVNPFLSKKPIR